MSPVQEIEQAAAASTVAYFGVDAVWIAPTRDGAVERAKEALRCGHSPEQVADALGRWTP